MKSPARSILLLLLLALLVPLAAGAVTAQDDLKVLVTTQPPGDPRSLDPQRAIDTRDWNLLNPLFPALTTLNEETGELVPGVAESWDVSEDGLTTTFHLVQESPWVHYNADTGAVEVVTDADGNPRYLTAQDFVYGWTRALDPMVGSSAAYILAPLVVGGVEFNAGEGSADALGLVAVDDYTFEVTAPEAVGYALGIYGIINARAVPAWAIDDAGDAWIEPENINTYGPFTLKEWIHEDSLTYARNPFWPGTEGYGQALLDEIVVRFLDGSVQLREYEAGNVDVVSVIPADQFDRIQADPTLSQELTIIPGACTGAWGFHTQLAPFDNVHIRRAFSYAIDRESLIANVVKGGQLPARWYTPPGVANAPTLEESPDLGIAFDADMAQQELQAGLEELGFGSAAELPEITAVFSNTEANNALAQALQIMWNATLGVTVQLNPLDPTTYWATMETDAGQIFAAGWCPDYNDANNYTRDVYRSDGIYNYGRWNSPAFDELVDTARVTTDPAARREMYTQAENLLVLEDAAAIPLVWNSVPALTKPNVIRTFASNNVQAYWKWDIE